MQASEGGLRETNTNRQNRNKRDRVVPLRTDLLQSPLTDVAEAVTYGNACRLASSDAFVAIDVPYRPRNLDDNPLYGGVAGHLETFLARQRDRDRSVCLFDSVSSANS